MRRYVSAAVAVANRQRYRGGTPYIYAAGVWNGGESPAELTPRNIRDNVPRPWAPPSPVREPRPKGARKFPTSGRVVWLGARCGSPRRALAYRQAARGWPAT